MEERLQKYMARCGVASRRKCEEIILSSKVKINDKVVNELGVKIDPYKDKVFYNGKRILPEENKLYIMLNKPEGYITSVKDEKGRKTILDLVKVNERIYPIGRLDYDSSGLILLTNDGDIYNKIIHPRVEVEKKYITLCKGVFSDEEIKKFENGIDIGYPLGAIVSKEDIELGNPLYAIRYYFKAINEQKSYKPEGKYAVFYGRCAYGESDDLYEKLYDYIKENNLRICSDAYEEYPLNELSTKDESKYCVKIEIMVESDDR